MKMPDCSVVMPLFNKEKEVPTTIQSVLSQTFRNFELIIVNDGSTDSSLQVIQSFSDHRISIISQENLGVSEARNRGVSAAKADLIVFIDADDLWQPEFLATIISLRDDFPLAKWFATGYEIIHPENGHSFSRLRGEAVGFRRGILPDYFGVATNSDPPVWSSATAVFRDALEAVGGFPVGIGSGEDLLTWARLAVRFPLAYDAQSLAVFRVSPAHRRADPADRVGQALRRLVKDFPEVPGLRRYMGLWYRIQAVMALRFDDTALARRRAWQALCCDPLRMRNGYTLILACLPEKFRRQLDRQARGLFAAKLPTAS